MARIWEAPWTGYGDTSALHIFTGPTETFDYLLNKQEQFMLDVKAHSSWAGSVSEHMM